MHVRVAAEGTGYLLMRQASKIFLVFCGEKAQRENVLWRQCLYVLEKVLINKKMLKANFCDTGVPYDSLPSLLQCFNASLLFWTFWRILFFSTRRWNICSRRETLDSGSNTFVAR